MVGVLIHQILGKCGQGPASDFSPPSKAGAELFAANPKLTKRKREMEEIDNSK